MSEENIIVIPTPNEAYHLISTCHPFKLRKAVLSVNGKDEQEVYVVALRGTNSSLNPKDPLGLPVCLRSACAVENVFFTLVKNAIMANVPEGSSIVFLAHSLGGMVSQQLAADDVIRTKYKILSVLAIGSPYVIKRGSKCPLRRLADSSDFIPHTCSIVLFANIFMGNIVHEYGGHFGSVVKSHCDSYEFSKVWRKYDCFGLENGGHSLRLTDNGADHVQI